MPVGELISIVALALSLAGSVVGGLVYAFKVGSLVTTLASAISKLSKVEERIETMTGQIPSMMTRLATLEDDFSAQRKKLSDYPAMREKLSSVNEEVDDFQRKNLAERLAVVESRLRVTPPRPTPAQQMPRITIPRKDPDE